jgi:hypothetical protein
MFTGTKRLKSKVHLRSNRNETRGLIEAREQSPRTIDFNASKAIESHGLRIKNKRCRKHFKIKITMQSFVQSRVWIWEQAYDSERSREQAFQSMLKKPIYTKLELIPFTNA